MWLVFFILLAVQAYEGWNKTKEVIARGDEPSLYLILYTSFSCVFVFPPLLVFFLEMIYNEQEKLKNPPMVYAKKEEETKSSENIDDTVPNSKEQNNTTEQSAMDDNKNTDA